MWSSRSAVVALGVSFLLAALAAAAEPAGAVLANPATSSRTSIHLYAPFNGGGVAAGIRIARTAAGYCWTTSSADQRGDAYRCFVGNYIYDPCFADQSSFANYVLCPLYTPVSKVLRINLTKRLPPNPGGGDPTRYPPWAVQATGGKWCTILTGATGEIAGMRINYGCTGGGILIGDPRRASSTWTIFYASSYRSSQFRPIALRSAWW